MSERDDLIAALLDVSNVRSETVTVEAKGVERKIGVRQMSMGVHGRLSAQLLKAHKNEDFDLVDKTKLAVVKECAFCLDDGKPLFVREADAARLKDQGCVGWIETIFDAAMRLMAAPNQTHCKIEIAPAEEAKPAADGKPAVPAKPAKVCGGQLMLGAPKCPWCGGDVPSAAEAAEKNC